MGTIRKGVNGGFSGKTGSLIGNDVAESKIKTICTD